METTSELKAILHLQTATSLHSKFLNGQPSNKFVSAWQDVSWSWRDIATTQEAGIPPKAPAHSSGVGFPGDLTRCSSIHGWDGK